MANDKAPRLDGFPYEFYNELWDMVDHDLHKVYLKDMHIGCRGDTFMRRSGGSSEEICRATILSCAASRIKGVETIVPSRSRTN